MHTAPTAHEALEFLWNNYVTLSEQVDLSANLNAGDVYIGSGAYAASTIDQRVVPFSNFAVYQLAA